MPRFGLTLALLKPSLACRPQQTLAVHEAILKEGLYITRKKTLKLNREQASLFYQEHEGKFFHNRLVTYISSGPIVAMLLTGTEVITRWRTLMGPTKVYRAQYDNPNSIRGAYGISDTRNMAHGSDSEESAHKEAAFFFPEFSIQTWMETEEPIYRQNGGAVFYDSKNMIHRIAET